MFLMSNKITVGEQILPVLTSVKIKKSVKQLTDKATIICPAVSHGRPLSFVSHLAKWQAVKIELGYDGKLTEEFTGYVKSVAIENNQVTIECEDPLYLFQRVTIPNGEMKDCKLADILSYVLGLVNSFISENGLGEPLTLNCNYSYGYTKFTFSNNATAYQVMEQIQKEGEPNIYILDGKLNILPQYTNTIGSATYSMQRNICKDGLKLKWRNTGDRKLLVTATATDKDGNKITATAGEDGDDHLNFESKTITNQNDLQTIADNLFKSKVYDGYEGSFVGWLVPFCDANYSVRLIDEANELKSGTYYVDGVEVDFSSAGGKRSVSVGALIAHS